MGKKCPLIFSGTKVKHIDSGDGYAPGSTAHNVNSCLAMNLYPYRETWSDSDPHANFKAEVANYTVVDPLPTLENLSQATGIPTPCLIRYVLVKWAASGADALLTLPPIVLTQMQQQVQQAEAVGTDAARLRAYEALRQIIDWLQVGLEPDTEAPS